MAEMHKCGQGWAYCDGNCGICATNTPTYTSTSTDDNFHWFGRNTDGKPTGGFGGKSGRSGFITRIEPGKEEPYTVIFTTADPDKYHHIKNECRKMVCGVGERKGGEQQ